VGQVEKRGRVLFVELQWWVVICSEGKGMGGGGKYGIGS